MTDQPPTVRRAGAAAARLAAVGSAVMLLLTVLGLTLTASPASSAAIDGGGANVVTPFDGSPTAGRPLASGGSATEFSLLLPLGAACTGDSADGGYRVQSYLVPSSVDPGTLTFNAGGPIPVGVGANLRQPLFQTTSSAFVDAQTALANPAGGPGPVPTPPAFNFALFSPGNVPAGQYNLGLACTKGAASATQLDKFWNARMTVVASASDQPAGFTWTSTPATTTTTSPGATTTSTAPGGSTTSTTRAGSTTTTAPGGTTTSTAPGASTSTTASASATTGGSPSGTSGLGGLPLTGSSSTTAIVVWAVLLLTFGRMAVLLARPPRVKVTNP